MSRANKVHPVMRDHLCVGAAPPCVYHNCPQAILKDIASQKMSR